MPAQHIKTKLLSAACLVLCLTHTALAQSVETTARKFDEFGDVLPTDMAARLDNFAIELQNNPNARGFMFVYRSHRDLPGLSGKHVSWMRDYVIHSREIRADQLAAIDGGTASCLWHELWVVPPGSTPKPREDAYPRGFGDTDVALKYDEYYYSTPQDVSDSFSTEYENGLEGFADALRKSPRSLAYIVAYEGYRAESWEEEDARGRKRTRGRVIIDSRGTARRELRRKKAALEKHHGISPSRVKLVSGGYRKWRGLELWLVPRGALPPVPTPNVIPARRRKH